MEPGFKLAVTAARKAQQNNKETYNFKRREEIIQVGDGVLLKIVAWDGKNITLKGKKHCLRATKY